MRYGHRHYYDVDVKHPRRRCQDIGDGVCIRAWDRGTDPEGSYFVAHDRPAGDRIDDPAVRCEGRVDIVAVARSDGTPNGPTWDRTPGTSLAAGNLTLSPSIQCLEHTGKVPGGHGFIQDGRWVPA